MKILLIDIDSLNPRHLGCYGYERPTSPTIDRLAARGTVFRRAYCSDAPCGPARAAMFSGRYGIANGVVTHHGRGTQLRDSGPFEYGEEARRRHPMLATFLHHHGIRPVSFTSFPERHRFWWFAAGWSELHNHVPGRIGNERADEVNPPVLRWIEHHAQEPDWLLHVHYWDPHRNYRCPPEWMDVVRAGGPPPAWPDEAAIEEHQALRGPFTPWGLYPWRKTALMPDQLRSRADFEQFITGYDASIRYCDHHIQQLLDALAAQGVLDELLIVITADHGEQQGDHGVYGDHVGLYEGAQRIPLIIVPGPACPSPVADQLSPGAADAFALGLDLGPTLAELCGLPIPSGWHGTSLLPQLRDPAAPGRERIVLTHGLYSAQRAVREGPWKLIRTYHPGLYHFPPVELFHLERDPYETNDLAAEHPELVARLDAELHRFTVEFRGYPGAPPDPLDWIIEDGPYKHVQPADWNRRLAAAGEPPIEHDGERHRGVGPRRR